jgi:PASTA domain
VPDVGGLTVQEACDLLVSAGLSCDRRNYARDWKVVDQSVQAWKPAIKGDRVTLTAQEPPAPGCDGWTVFGLCMDPLAVIGAGVGVGTLILGVLGYLRRRQG